MQPLEVEPHNKLVEEKVKTIDSECRNPNFGLATKAKGVARVRA